MPQWLRDLITNHWDLILLLITWAGLVAEAIRRRRNWKRKRFTEQVNFSLNYIEDGTLMLRTLLEGSAESVWLNKHGVNQVRQAAEKTTIDEPFLRLRSKKDMDYINRAVLNVLSERFSQAFVAKALGLDVHTDRFVFGVTWEKYGGIRTQKLRVIIIRKDDLLKAFNTDGESERPKVVEPEHDDRIKTLRKMFKLYMAQTESGPQVLGEAELGIPGPGPGNGAGDDSEVAEGAG